MRLLNGYETKSTFYEDFSIADLFGKDAILDTFERAFKEWKNDYVYLTELVIALNFKIWYWYERDEEIARLYDELWRKADLYAVKNLKDEELLFFYRITD